MRVDKFIDYMIIFCFLLLLIIFNGARFEGASEFNDRYLDRKYTAAVNGIFVILVIFSHYSQYAAPSGPLDNLYITFKDALGQLVVSTFWFYSGYGMMEAVRRTDGAYIDKLPSKFWKLLIRFDVAVLIFWAVNAVLGTLYPLKTLLPALTGWESVGNSNWYIFAMLVEYLLMYAAFKAGRRMSRNISRIIGLALMFLLTVTFVYVLMKADRPPYTYNTIIILPFGALFSESRKRIERIVMRNDLSYLLNLATMVVIYAAAFFRSERGGIEAYTIWAISFICIVIMLTMKISIYNPLLEWFGRHIFSIYMLQRLPMLVLAHFGYVESHRYISLIITLAVSMPMALLFESFTDVIIAGVKKALQQAKGDAING